MFSKKPAQNLPAATVRSVASRGGATFSVIGPDVTIRGDIEASADLHIDGSVIGDISCAALVQGETSHIEGTLSSESARLSGTVKGTIAVRDLVVLKSAAIEGDVSYETLTIEQGAAVNGRFSPKSAASSISAAPDKPELTKLELTLAG